jgi:hypothetical protein
MSNFNGIHIKTFFLVQAVIVIFLALKTIY